MILELSNQAVMKPQYVDQIPRAIKGSVQSLLDKKNEMDNQVSSLTYIISANFWDLLTIIQNWFIPYNSHNLPYFFIFVTYCI